MCCALELFGYKWYGGDSLVGNTNWNLYSESGGIKYYLDSDRRVTHSGIAYTDEDYKYIPTDVFYSYEDDDVEFETDELLRWLSLYQ